MAALRSAAAIGDDKPGIKPSIASAVKLPPIVCLHTEYMPLKEEEALKYRLIRELGRQALLIAARDELGLSTRDETLGEVFPDSVTQAKQDLYVAVRAQYDGTTRFQLWLALKPEELLPTKKEKQHESRVILNQTEKLEARSRGELCEKLRSLGFTGKIAPPNEKNLPPDEVEGQLLEMNFVSQFAAVRAAHAAIAERGRSRAWLSVLARGYANLSLMTQHHWKSDTEVFAARALLYAERLAAGNPDDSLTIAHRAYVRAIVGLHGAALDDVKHINELQKQHADQPSLPNWFELIEPYCSFEREPVVAIGERRPSLRQIAQRLSFEQYRAFGDDRWLFESAKQSMSICPEEYGIYAALTRGSGSLLSIVRTGAYYAPAALAHFLPARIAALPNLPRAVADAAKGVSAKQEEQNDSGEKKPKRDSKKPAPDAESIGEFAADTSPIVEALRAATKNDEEKGEPTWSALGELIFEEQFVQAANYLSIAMNATESSHEDEVKSILPAIKGHRYAAYIESYALQRAHDPSRFAQIIDKLKVMDPRGNMQPMFWKIWREQDEKGRDRLGYDASWYAYLDRSLTFTGMLESYDACANMWWNDTDAETRKRLADEYGAISPRSPQALRMAIVVDAKPNYEQVIKWEAEAGDDPIAYSWLGNLFTKLEHHDDAIRVYEHSIKLSPSKDAYVSLANTHYAAGHEELWQPTLERFFEVESLGLEHAAVHSLIANYLVDRGKLQEAQPHAVAAAETWSAWGLMLASRVEEGLGHWDESEKWIREAANAYPTSSGGEWYFWCRRTGRGNLEEARKVAQTYFNAAWIKTDLNGQIELVTFHLTENDAHSASADIKNIIQIAGGMDPKDEDIVRAHIQAAFISRELKETEGEQAAVKEIRRLTERIRAQYAHLASVYTAIADILEGKPPTDEALTALDKEIVNAPKELRVNCYYFLGRAFDLAGNQGQAERYWKECVIRGPYERYPATLAGKYLADRHKTSRP